MSAKHHQTLVVKSQSSGLLFSSILLYVSRGLGQKWSRMNWKDRNLKDKFPCSLRMKTSNSSTNISKVLFAFRFIGGDTDLSSQEYFCHSKDNLCKRLKFHSRIITPIGIWPGFPEWGCLVSCSQFCPLMGTQVFLVISLVCRRRLFLDMYPVSSRRPY